MSTVTIPAELATVAARAWMMLVEAGMLPEACVDWVREESGCEDVQLVKLALYGAAAKPLPVEFIEWKTSPTDVAEEIMKGDLVGAGTSIYSMSKIEEESPSSDDNDKVISWLKQASKIVNFCRQIEAV